MGAAKHFFDNKDVDKRIKLQIYVAAPLKMNFLNLSQYRL